MRILLEVPNGDRIAWRIIGSVLEKTSSAGVDRFLFDDFDAAMKFVLQEIGTEFTIKSGGFFLEP